MFNLLPPYYQAQSNSPLVYMYTLSPLHCQEVVSGMQVRQAVHLMLSGQTDNQTKGQTQLAFYLEIVHISTIIMSPVKRILAFYTDIGSS